jgi:hypothetical protein
MTGDMYKRTGLVQTDLPHLSDALDNEDWDSCNEYGVEETRTECVTQRE